MDDRCSVCDRKIWHCECSNSEKPKEENFNKEQFINREHNKKFPDNKKRDEE